MSGIVLPGNGALTESNLSFQFDVWSEINKLRVEKKAVILAHYYQDPDIQDLADFVGDSLDLSRAAASTNAEMIVFCGVRFMGEVAKILSPKKRVVIPDADAGCSLEEACPVDAFSAFRASHPNHVAITYINCSAEIKALSDVIVTSSNAEHIINQIPKDREILFAPDRHLGKWLEQRTGRKFLLWDGVCIVHDRFSEQELLKIKADYPNAEVAAHPECHDGILQHASHIGSTRSLLDFVTRSEAKEFIIATEQHILHEMKKQAPGKLLIPAPGNDGSCDCSNCPFMELNTLDKVYLAMANEAPRIEIAEPLRRRALQSIEKMLDMSPPVKQHTVQAAE